MKWNKFPECCPKPVLGLNSSVCVLVIRDCGDGSIPCYSVSSYSNIGWGGHRRNEQWLDQESKGYRVLAWAELEEPEKILDILAKTTE